MILVSVKLINKCNYFMLISGKRKVSNIKLCFWCDTSIAARQTGCWPTDLAWPRRVATNLYSILKIYASPGNRARIARIASEYSNTKSPYDYTHIHIKYNIQYSGWLSIVSVWFIFILNIVFLLHNTYYVLNNIHLFYFF